MKRRKDNIEDKSDFIEDWQIPRTPRIAEQAAHQTSMLRFLLLICLSSFVVQFTEALPEVRCNAIDLRNHPMEKWNPDWANCTVIEGHLLIVMMSAGPNTTSQSSYPIFKQLVEVTGHLLVFSADKLVSLGTMLPQLRVIGGTTQVQHYSLIVFQNEDIRELNLHNLRVIRNGGVRITENQKMCYAKSINWKHMQYGQTNDLVVDDSDGSREDPCYPYCFNGNSQDQCPKPAGSEVSACWGKHSCQKRCPYDRDPKEHSVIGPGCVDHTDMICHPECIAGCKKPNDANECYACRSISHKGECVETCPTGLFVFRDRRCLTMMQCEEIEPYGPPNALVYYKALSGRCSYECPEGQEDDPDTKNKKCRPCKGECFKKCPGNRTINTIHQAETLARCTVIDGFLEIEMRIGLDLVPASDLSKAFKSIREIHGYLAIRMSHAFINLHMFENLQLITGDIVEKEKYSLIIYENHNLQKLFPPNTKLVLRKGTMQIINNPLLCPDRVFELFNSTGHAKELSAEDASLITNSNGDKATCSDTNFELEISNEKENQFTISFPHYDTSNVDYRKFMGYEIFYKEVDKRDPNITTDHDRSACSDSWNNIFISIEMEIIDNEYKNGSITVPKTQGKDSDFIDNGNATIASFIIQPNTLRSNTLYAVYAQATVVRHAGAINYISSVAFAQTKFGTPDSPKVTRAEAISSTEIIVEWDAPQRPNGNVTHYKVNYYPQSYDVKSLESPAVCRTKSRTSEVKPTVEVESAKFRSAMFLSTVAPDTCTASGCCVCQETNSGKPRNHEPAETSDSFENELQNSVFVRKRESVVSYIVDETPTDEHQRHKRDIEDATDPEEAKTLALLEDRADIIQNIEEQVVENEAEEIKSARETASTEKQVRTTERSITLEDLKPYTDYWVIVIACHDEDKGKCSKITTKARKKERTKPIEGADVINASTINVEVRNETQAVITWMPPENPNGPVLGYTAKIQNIRSNATPIEICEHIGKLLDEKKKDTEENRWKPDVHGILFEGLSEGDYRVEVRTITLHQPGIVPAVMEGTFNIYIKGWWTWQRILIALGIFLLIVIVSAFIGNHYFRKYYGKRVKEYATQLISANPEYLSQADVYKADEWELKREDIILSEEIGHGTFGKVYRGEGKNVASYKGVIFGECAVKTVSEAASCADRVHFLMEASVMKQFDASYIVKLFGVVSDGQPVLVVMEMMSRGNLRDHLRARRPDNYEIPADEKMPVPNLEQYYEWAAQIADGMAYLESLRFCHRDLAARNCMVHEDLTVKIGDFGMARDLYYHEYYKPTGKRLMPVRWMAPESLKDGKFDSKSDVWAYGIVLYEMITLGQQPYQGLANDEILTYIGQSRRHLDQPQGCPKFWYELMEECWKYSPKDRPSFYHIVRHLLYKKPLSEVFKQNSYVVQNPYDGEEEEGSPRSSDEIEQMEIAEDEDEYVMKSANRAGLDEPGWGEGDSLAGKQIPNGHA